MSRAIPKTYEQPTAEVINLLQQALAVNADNHNMILSATAARHIAYAMQVLQTAVHMMQRSA